MLACATPARGAADWVAPRTIAEDIPLFCPFICFPSSSPAFAVAPDGGVLAFWVQGSESMWSYRAPGGDWTPPQSLGPVVVTEAAFDGAGNATAVLSRYDSVTDTLTVEVLYRSAGGTFGSPIFVSDPVPGGPQPRLAVNTAGATVVTWVANDRIAAAYRAAGGSDFTVAPSVSAAGGSPFSPTPAIDPEGNALVAWIRTVSGPVVEAAYRAVGVGFDATPDVVSEGDPQAIGGAAFDDAGNAVVLWNRFVPSGSGHPQANHQIVERAFRPASSGMFDGAVSISDDDATNPMLAVGPDGEAVAVWNRADAVEASVRPPGGEFGTAAPISGMGGGTPLIAMNDTGHTLVAWRRFDGPGSAVSFEASARPPGGSFGPVDEIAPVPNGGGSLLVGVDGEGNGAALYGPLTGTGTSDTEDLLVAGYDAAPPRLGPVGIPGGGMAGSLLPFSAAALDVWSPFVTSWSFGDGAMAEGGSVQHAYAAPGDYGVGVSATDALGNASSAAGNVTITPAALGPGAVLDPDDPLVEELAMLRRRFAVDDEPTPVNLAQRRRGRARKGSAFRFTLSEPARVAITIERARRGRRVRGRCVKPRRRNRRRPRCTRFRPRGTLTRTGVAGPNDVPFSGRIGTRALRRGRYRASIVATDAAGNASAPARIRFRIVR